MSLKFKRIHELLEDYIVLSRTWQIKCRSQKRTVAKLPKPFSVIYKVIAIVALYSYQEIAKVYEAKMPSLKSNMV